MDFLKVIITTLLIVILAACTEKEQSKTTTAEKKTHEHTMQAETSSDVPELWEFHEVIYQI